MPVIVKPSDYFNVVTYTGTGSSQTISVGFQPDFVWIKSRSNAQDHKLTDAVRGVTKSLESNTTDAEATDTNGITAFTSTGFTVGSDSTYNTNAYTYVAWCWKANGAGSSNTAGSITSTVSANTSAGFSIVTYTGTGANATVGHGLGVAPRFIIVKDRTSGGTDWYTRHSSYGGNDWYQQLNLTSGVNTTTTIWNNTAPTSTVFSLGTSGAANNSGSSFVAYCFAEVAGYSSFNSYTGNGSTDGVFVYTGFRPKFIMIKRVTGGTGSWAMYDTSRNTFNVSDKELAANESSSEYTRTEAHMDILSNGFKLRNTDGWHNVSGSLYIYMAVAENPFKYANAR
jgi:hypothetical protein